MRILVTNDDGIESEGIRVLARALAATGHDIVVVAPDRDHSGVGAAIGNLRPDTALAVQRVELDGAPAVPAWALAGPPGLTVVAGVLGAFGPPPDLVVSGINAGLNTGRSVLHSGTVGAALTAQNFGLSALAVSVEATDPWHWDTAAATAVSVLDLLRQAPTRSVLNLNVPGRPAGEVRGVRWARLAPFGAVRTAIVGTSDEQIQFEFQPSGHQPGADTDQGTVEAGWASLTTIVGVVEAWPPTEGLDGVDLDHATLPPHLVPGAELHAVHRLPDPSDHHLRRSQPAKEGDARSG